MSSSVDIMASAVQDKPHSFQFIRKATGLTMTDEEFRSMAKKNSARFKLVRFMKRDDEGTKIGPGLPGVALRKS
jgi:hypothetical protein